MATHLRFGNAYPVQHSVPCFMPTCFLSCKLLQCFLIMSRMNQAMGIGDSSPGRNSSLHVSSLFVISTQPTGQEDLFWIYH